MLTINVNIEHGQRRPIGYDWWGLLTCKISNGVIFELMTVGHDYPTNWYSFSYLFLISYTLRVCTGKEDLPHSNGIENGEE